MKLGMNTGFRKLSVCLCVCICIYLCRFICSWSLIWALIQIIYKIWICKKKRCLYIDGILPKGPYPPCVSPFRALLAGYPRYMVIYLLCNCGCLKLNCCHCFMLMFWHWTAFCPLNLPVNDGFIPQSAETGFSLYLAQSCWTNRQFISDLRCPWKTLSCNECEYQPVWIQSICNGYHMSAMYICCLDLVVLT